jgi:NitT/TauT family transport system substrate-binding protein
MSSHITRRVLLGSAAGLAAANAAGLHRVSFASVNALSDAGVFLADELGYFAEVGIACDYNVINNAPGLIAAAITGQVDVAGVAITPGLFAAAQRGINIRIVGDKQSIRQGFSNTRMVMRAASFHGDKSAAIAQLRGKSLADTSRGSTGFYLMAKTLAKHGVALSDVRIVEMGYSNIVAALSNGAVEAGILLEPHLTKAIRAGIAVELSDCADVAPGTNPSIVSIVYSERFLAETDLARRWMLAYVRGVRAYNDAIVKNIGRERVIAVLAAHTHIDPSVIRDSYPVGLDPNQNVDLVALAEFEKFFVEIGLLHKQSDVSTMVDPSFAQYAIAQLGRYS